MIGLALFIVMEMAWIAGVTWLADGFITRSPDAAPRMALMVLAYPAAVAAMTAIDRLTRPVWRIAATMLAFATVAGIAVAGLLPGMSAPTSVRPGAIADWFMADQQAHRAVAVIAIVGFCWVRGAMLAGRQIDGHVVGLGFQIGLGALLGVHGLAALGGVTLPGATALAIVFVMTGLLALWHQRAGSRDGHRRDPAGAVLGLVLVLAATGVVMAAVHPAALQVLLDLVLGIRDAILAAIVWFFSLFPDPDPTEMDMPPPDGAPAGGEPASEPPLFQPVAWLRMVFAILFFGTFAVMIALMLLLNLRDLIAWLRRRIRRTPGLAYDRSPRGFGATVLAIWSALIEAFMIGLSRVRRAFTPFWGSGDRPSAERRLYTTLLSRLHNRGWPRRAAETPLEYAGRMKGPWPGGGGDIKVLTRRFMADRYGAITRSPTPRLSRLWKKIRRSLDRVPYRNDPPDAEARPTTPETDNARQPR